MTDWNLGTKTLREEELKAAAQILRTAPEARAHTKRMLNESYKPIDYQTMFWSLQNSTEPREGMRAFMEKREPNWAPDGLPKEGE
jgi:enoyl-CoA hydratase/carnithine racemase